MATLWISKLESIATQTSPILSITLTDNVGAEDSNSLSLNGARLTLITVQAQATFVGGSPPEPEASLWIYQLKTDAAAGIAPPSATIFVEITDTIGATDETDNQRFDWQYSVTDDLGVADSQQTIFTPHSQKIRKTWYGGEWITPVRRVWYGGNWRPITGV